MILIVGKHKNRGNDMSEIKVVFFDRDNTLTYKNQSVLNKYYKLVESVSGKPFCEDKQKMFETFKQIKDQGFCTDSYEKEVLFYMQYYKQVLINQCGYCDEKIEVTAKQIFDIMWLGDRLLFDDVLPTFKELKKMGIQIGIISDTTLSLQKTFEALGLSEYIDCYTSSKEVGVMKPNPQIYLSALGKLNVTPQQCLYVDDYDEEVVGALNLGIKSFRINRTEDANRLEFDISSLTELLKFI